MLYIKGEDIEKKSADFLGIYNRGGVEFPIIYGVSTAEEQTQNPKPEMPDWLKRTNFAVEAGTNQKPKYFFETIQPLLGTQEKDVVFLTNPGFRKENPGQLII